MKTRKRSLRAGACGILLSACLMITWLCGASAVHAEEDTEPYTYTVRIFAGDHGTINGGNVQVAEGLSGDDDVQIGAISITKGPYDLVKGVRESGKGDGDSIYVGSVPVNGRDRDYVVVYGVSGSTVKYTVNYVDADGNPLAGYGPEEFYGNVGDKVIVPCKRIPGYFPDAENKTKAKNGLSADAGSNVFTFVYQPNPEVPPHVTTVTETVNETVERTETVETTVAAPTAAPAAPASPAGNTGGTGNTAGNTGTPGGSTDNAAESTGTTGVAENAAGAQEDTGTQSTDQNTAAPEVSANNTESGQSSLPATPDDVPEIVDIDEESVPMAGVGDDEAVSESAEAAADEQEEPVEEGGHGGYIAVIIGLIAVICVAAVAAILIFRNKEKDM